MSKKWSTVYLAVSADEYSLPTAEFDTIFELQVYLNCSKKEVIEIIKNQKIKFNCKYIAVKIKK